MGVFSEATALVLQLSVILNINILQKAQEFDMTMELTIVGLIISDDKTTVKC